MASQKGIMTEDQAVAALRRLAKRWPPSLWLFSASGTLWVMREPDDQSSRATHPGGGMRQDLCVADIDGIANDGGDW